MEKEKKEVKKTKVVKKEKVENKNIEEESVIIRKRDKSLVKFAALLAAFFATGMGILIFVFAVISTISSANLSSEALINNNIVVTFISKLNGYTALEVQDVIGTMTNRFTFIILEIIIPTIAFVGTMILIILLAKRAIDFVSDVKTEKDLYNKSKLEDVKDIISILAVVFLATFVIFNKPSIIIYLLINLLLWIIYLLFKKCVLAQK